jgi:protein gp37
MSILPESRVDVARLQLERIKRSWVEFALELRDFHEQERWRDLGYGSLADCAEAELGWSKGHISRVMAAAETIATLQEFPAGNSPLPLPTSEWQTRELAPLRDDPERLASTWQQAVETAPRDSNGQPQITRGHIAEIVRADPVIPPRTPPLTLVDGMITLPVWQQLSPSQQQHVLARPHGNQTFNSQSTDSIEWARWSWNPVTGCRHNCSFCYARDIAARFYPQGFVPTFLPERLGAPSNTHVPSMANADIGFKNVFTCSMADLFGKWVPREWIEAVLAVVRSSPEWNFLMLTKFPQRLMEFDFPPNAWVGTTVDAQARVKVAEDAFAKVNATVRWLSLEPLLEPLRFEHLERFQWLVIGGASASSETPEWRPPLSWVADLERQARAVNARVYHKTNLYERRREYPGAEPPERINVADAFHMRYLQRDVLEPEDYAEEMFARQPA